MSLNELWAFLHLFFAFSYVGSLVVAEWNGRVVRVSRDWGTRVALLEIMRLSSRVAGLGSLVLLGVFGNLLAVGLGGSMATDLWLQAVNTLWLLGAAAMAFVSLPAVRRLAALARDGGGAAGEWERALARWRVANVFQSLFYLTMLVLMVARGRP
jgi:hypothetical protein